MIEKDIAQAKAARQDGDEEERQKLEAELAALDKEYEELEQIERQQE